MSRSHGKHVNTIHLLLGLNGKTECLNPSSNAHSGNRLHYFFLDSDDTQKTSVDTQGEFR